MIHFGREITGSLEASLRREWLVTNGLGGYALGTLAGSRTRRYHGLLVAALRPPVERTLLVAGLDAWVEIDGRRSPLVTHEWAAGVVLPDGYRHLESFRLEGSIPVFVWGLGDLRLEQRIWMAHGRNTTYVTYTYQRGAANVRMALKPLCAWRDHHKLTKGGYPVQVQACRPAWPDGAGIVIRPQPERSGEPAGSFRMLTNRGTLTPEAEWWWSFHLSEEKRRGLDDQEDLFAAGALSAHLRPGDTLAVVFTAEEASPDEWQAALAAEQDRQRALLDRAELDGAPDWIRQLALAADQFVVARQFDGRQGQTIVAGYPWFSDWGRDTLISLPGLTLALGRAEEAAAILRTYARYVSQGMLPNRFPEVGETPDYNQVDATLWYFQAIYAYWRAAAHPDPLLRELYPVLVDILGWHIRGTRFAIHQDQTDGLLYAGLPGTQLTWMDAKVDEWVVTPRVGKPVEVNALWYNALRITAELAATLGEDADASRFSAEAERVRASFRQRFWYSGGYLCDVVDGPEGDDLTLRPNQLLAVSLPFDLVERDQARAVVDLCARELIISYGLRSLAPDESEYVGHYGGGRVQRDGSYHQGTAWAWLLGPFLAAHYRVYGDAALALSYLAPLADHLDDAGLGSISEIFDGDPPHTPRGAVAQAWSVSEALRLWRILAPELVPQPAAVEP